MSVEYAKPSEFDAWLELAREVEPLFGPMADQQAFRDGLRQAIASRTAFCIRPAAGEDVLTGGIVIARESNEIAWLAVSRRHRGQGFGRELLGFAIGELDRREPILVQTFVASVREGAAARRLYQAAGFVDHADGGLNPAGVPTVLMRLADDA